MENVQDENCSDQTVGASMTDTTNKTATVYNSFSAPQIEDTMNKIKLQVDRLFRDAPPVHGQQCENPVTGGRFVYGVDPIEPQKKAARAALLARERFAIVGPKDMQPLLISCEEIEDRKYAWESKQPARDFIRSCFGASVRANDHDLESHPGIEDFARGIMASEHAPDFVKNDEALRKEYPPCPLAGLGPALIWEPPAIHAETMASYRRSMARWK